MCRQKAEHRRAWEGDGGALNERAKRFKNEFIRMVRREEARRAQELQTAWQPPQKPAVKAAPKTDAAALAREKQKARDWILQYAVEESDSDGEGSQVYIASLSCSDSPAE